MKHFLIFLKGMAMGAADVIPGVSGGTIAFITGIYDELLHSINAVNFQTLKILKKEGVAAAWKSVNGNFLASLLLGIIVSVFTFAKIFQYLIAHHPVLVWSFFFGLILGSIYLVGKQVGKWNWIHVLSLAVGTVISYYITIMPVSGDSDSLLYIFVCGMVAICAMILPGISGSFILLLMGGYMTVLGSVSGLMDGVKAGDMTMVADKGILLAIFAMGCVIGLLSFSRLLEWTLKRYHAATVALLTGFLVGSLNKIWPWKMNTQTRINSKNEVVAFLDKNVLPGNYADASPADIALGLTDKQPQLAFSLLLMLAGVVLLFVMEKFAPKNKDV